MTELTVVVLYYKNWPIIETTLRRLLDEVTLGTHIVVVDNASGDGAMRKVKLAFPAIEIIVRESNGGYAAGMNDGLRAARTAGSSFALLLTHECLLEPGAVPALMRVMSSDQKVALVGPVLSTQEAPVRVFSAGGSLKGRALVPQHVRRNSLSNQNAASIDYDVDWVDGACMLLRLSVIDSVGMLNEAFFLYVEEVEFALRLRRGGHRVICAGQARASQSTSGIPPYYEARNQLMLTRMHGRRSALAGATAWQVWCAVQDLRHGRATGSRRRISGLMDFYRGKTGPQRG